MLRKELRLQKTHQFRDVRRRGQAYKDKFFLLNLARNNQNISRFGFVVENKIGHAPARHRVKRVLREVVRSELGNLKEGYDVVVVALCPEVTELDFWAVQTKLKALLKTAGLLKGRLETK